LPSEYAGAWKLLYDWQTLITGVMALVAAGVAAWLVWRQIRSLEVQSAVMGRETLVMRVAAIESRREITRQKMSSITTEFMARLHPYEDGGEPPDINTEWAHEAEQIANGVVAVLIAHQDTSLDGESIDAKRKATIQQAKMLSDCLSKIHTPYSADLEDPDWNLTTDEITAVKEDGARAEKNLEDHISVVSKSAGDLDAAFRAGLNQLRSRIRRIDALVTHDKRSRPTIPSTAETNAINSVRPPGVR
jgi:hypothetical protein